MNLAACKLALGVVQATDDEKKEGRIQFVVPGYINNANIPKEIMPWARPLSMTSAQSFSMPQVGNKVLVLINEQNYNEFWYLPFSESLAETNGYVQENYENNPEVIYNKDDGGTHQSRITYDDEHGFQTRIGNNVISLRPDDQIDISTASGTGLGVSADNVYVGKSDENTEWNPAVLGNKLVSLIDEIVKGLSSLSNAASSSWQTAHLALPIENMVTEIESKKSEILSKNVKLS